MYYEFHQSNPGGSFDATMPCNLIVEADSADEANTIAEAHGVYFDGQSKGIDCEEE